MMDYDQKFIQKLNRRTRFTQFLVWMALFFTAVGIAAGYSNWLRIHEKAKAGLVGIAQINEKLSTFADKEKVFREQKHLNEILEKNTDFVNAALKEVRQLNSSTQAIADTVDSQIESLTLKQTLSKNVVVTPIIQEWSLSEIHYLLQSAIQTLTLKNDKVGALKALGLADDLLLKQGSIGLLPVRKKIHKEIAALEIYRLPNIEVISAEIDNLLDLLATANNKRKDGFLRKKEDIPITGVVDSKSDSTKGDDVSKQESSSLVSLVKETINNAVVVRKFDEALEKTMNREDQDRLYQLFSLRLETLRLLLLQGRNNSYHQQIERIRSLFLQYYSAEKAVLFNKQLEKLKAVELSPEIPDISESLKLLESIIPTLSKGE